jgi:putative membrane-bound dehydrogenase-like protein
VIITCAPNIIIFTDENGDDVPDRKEYLFTESGRPQSDHSTHSVLPGPDGRLYWNTGDYGDQVKDHEGQLMYDRLGNAVIDRRRIGMHPEVDPGSAPYIGGMVFRFNPDGSDFEVLAHNFRNNYEVAIDSFGSLWQTDNDDDGFNAVRLNFVMEYGNYGFRDELTGAPWRTPRVSEHPEVHRRHWHQNDPGVVPDFAYTGAGSPTGLTVYEGRLLPEVFWDEVIACDAGPGVVWAVKAQQDGAGFSGEVIPLMQSRGARGWFRPVDVAVAPDGSLFVSDWHDPAVGGNRQLDPELGRIYRLAPPKTPYRIPKIDFDTASNAAEALLIPNAAVQYKARLALAAMGEESLDPLIKVFSSLNMRHRARALWLLSKMESGPEWIDQALSDANADIRITALRAARARRLPMEPLLKRVVNDESPAVRREAAIALRELNPEAVPALWVELARQHVSSDRWYLEALGIGASHAWDGCMRAWLEHGGDIATQSGRDIVWRSERQPRRPS